MLNMSLINISALAKPSRPQKPSALIHIRTVYITFPLFTLIKMKPGLVHLVVYGSIV